MRMILEAVIGLVENLLRHAFVAINHWFFIIFHCFAVTGEPRSELLHKWNFIPATKKAPSRTPL
jgi:hypothetical protein